MNKYKTDYGFFKRFGLCFKSKVQVLLMQVFILLFYKCIFLAHTDAFINCFDLQLVIKNNPHKKLLRIYKGNYYSAFSFSH